MFIFVEKCGRCSDGTCRSMRGINLTPYTAAVFSEYREINPTAVSFGVGDGGNEIGCGNFEFPGLIPRSIKCVVPTDGTLLCDISNLGALLLSRYIVMPGHLEYFQENLTEREFVQLLVENGAVDGVLARRVVSVDGMDFEEYMRICKELWE